MTPETLRHHYTTPVSAERLATLRRAWDFATARPLCYSEERMRYLEALEALRVLFKELIFCNRALLLDDLILYGNNFKDADGWRIDARTVYFDEDGILCRDSKELPTP